MKVLILAAGYGTRLYALVKDTPKPLLEIAGKPLIEYLLDKIDHVKDLNEVLVVTNNKFYTHFVNWAKAQKGFPAPIAVINDQTNSPEDRLGSVGDMHFVLRNHKVADDLLVMGGDNHGKLPHYEDQTTSERYCPRYFVLTKKCSLRIASASFFARYHDENFEASLKRECAAPPWFKYFLV